MAEKGKNPLAGQAVKTTEFAKESEAAAPQSKAMVQLFGSVSNLPESMKGLKRMNLPAMVDPKTMPVGGVLTGVIVDFVPSMKKTIKGKLIWLKVTTGEGADKLTTDITFPCAGAIQAVLAPDAEKDKDGNYDSAKLYKLLAIHIGKTLALVRRPDGYNKQYDRSQYSFDVFLSDK